MNCADQINPGLQLHQRRPEPDHLGPGFSSFFNVACIFFTFLHTNDTNENNWLLKVEVWGLDAILDVAYEGALWSVILFLISITFSLFHLYFKQIVFLSLSFPLTIFSIHIQLHLISFCLFVKIIGLCSGTWVGLTLYF